MANGRTEAERRMAAVVLAGLVLVPIAGVAWFVAFYLGARGREVGPDADEMAEDPVLHVEVVDASPGEIHVATGREGGIAPALANSVSSARRDWALPIADWPATLLTAVEEVDLHEVTWWSLSCSDFAAVFHGRTEVVVGEEALFATVDVGVYGLDEDEPFLRITLSSDGIDRPGPGAPQLPEPRVYGGCPPAISEGFGSLRS